MTPQDNSLEKAKPLAGIDRLIHEPARFLIMAHLYVVESADFLFLKNQTKLTQGNLSSHLSKLETAQYIQIKKEFISKKPHTILSITDAGRSAFQNYRQNIKQLIDQIPQIP